MLNKKGGMQYGIAGAAIILVIAFIVISIVPGTLKAAEETATRATCENSVNMAAKSKLLGKPLLDNVNCETITKEITSKNREIVKQEITNEMYSCWNQFGKGKVDFLNDWDFGKGNNWCFICSRIDANDDVKKEIPELSVDEFNKYFASEPIPFNEEQTFYEYFYGEGGSNIDSTKIDFSIDLQKPVYVLFFADKRTDFVKDVTSIDKTEASGLVSGCFLGAKVGATTGALIASIPSVGVAAPLGAAAGAIAGCVGGMSFVNSIETLARKTEFVSGIYVGNSETIVEACSQ